MSNSTTASPLPQPHLTPLPPFLPPIPDSILLLLLPIIIYWTLSLFFHVLDTYDLLAQYRLHTPEELLKRNHVTRREVIRDVILQQIIQTIIGGAMALLEGVDMTGNEAAEIQTVYRGVVLLQRGVVGLLALLGVDAVGVAAATGLPDLKYKAAEVMYWYLLPVARIGLAIFVLDTWQYFLHRLMHEVKWLYRTFHSRHHRLYVPYAFGALYNHPVEGLLMDTIGASLGYKISGLGTRGGMVFFSFSTMKTVDDHCGYALPWDPLQKMFWNNAGYHDIHHQSWGIKTNYSQPFLICWDRWLNTQWTGNPATTQLKYTASRERAAAAVAADHKAGTNKQDSIPNPPSPTDSEAEAELQHTEITLSNGSVVNGHGNAVNGHANGYANASTPPKNTQKSNGNNAGFSTPMNGHAIGINGIATPMNGAPTNGVNEHANGNGVALNTVNGTAKRSRSHTPGVEAEMEGLRRSARIRNSTPVR